MILSAGTHLGPYEILGPIGEGGMGVVYRARDPRLARQVAIKLLPHGLAADPEAQERLRFEAIAAAALDHPYICKIYEVGEHEGDVFLVMEYIAGETLRQRLVRGRLTLPETQRIAGEITDALEAAHAGGILHRDLKPANIMLTQQGHVKIMDFGLAKRMASVPGTDLSITQLTMPGAILGTPAYMSPEQVKALPLDARSDLFSLGVILAEMASGISPFQRPSMAETMTAVLHDPPQLSPDLPPGTLMLLGRLLAKAPEDRFASAGELRQHLAALVAPSMPASSLFPPTVETPTWTPVKAPQAAASWGAAEVPPPSQPNVQPMLAPSITPMTRRQRKRMEKELERTGKSGRRIPWILLPLLFFFWPNIQRAMHTQFSWLLPESVKTAVTTTPATIRSIAVLPLDNDSNDPTQDDLAGGITDELTSDLAGISQLRVISQNSTMQYKGDHRPSTPEIAKALHVDALLEGSVSRSGDTVRVTAQLIDAHADKQLWSKSFARKSSDVLKLEDELASAIASEIHVPLSPVEKTRLSSASTINPAAHQAYLQGRFLLDRPGDDNLRKSIGFFQKAATLAPEFAPAWSALSEAYLQAGADDQVMTSAAARPKAYAAAAKALAADPDSAAAHTALAIYKSRYECDWQSSEAEFKRAIELDPSDVLAHDQYGVSLALQGRLEESQAEGKRAEALDPLSPQIAIDTVPGFAFDGDFDAATDQIKHAEALNPTSFFPHWAAGWIDLQQGEATEAIPELRQAQALGAPAFVTAWLGYAYGVSGDHTQALAQMDDLKRTSTQGHVPPFHLALIYLGLGDKQHALDDLEQAHAADSQSMAWLKGDKVFTPLHDEPRYRALIKTLHFTR